MGESLHPLLSGAGHAPPAVRPYRRWRVLVPAVLVFIGWITFTRALPGMAGSAAVCSDPLDQWQAYEIDPARPTRAVFIAAADLNGDDFPDLVTGAWWYENPGAIRGTWRRHAIGAPLAQMAAVRDFDGDTFIDILGTVAPDKDKPWRGNAFVWARNDGAGNFTVYHNIDAGSGDFLQGVAAGSFRPGVTEVILSWHHGDRLESLTVPGDPLVDQWTIRDFSSTTQSEALSAGKIDGDNDLDLLLGTIWLENNGASSSWPARTLFNPGTAKPDRNRLALINDDGRPDAVVGYEAISKPGKLAWYEQPANNPAAAWTEHVIATVTGPMSLDVADMDGDLDLDVVVGEHNLDAPATARLLIYENGDGRGGDWSAHVVDTGDEHHDGAQVADLDNDNDLDIYSIGWGHNKVLVYENQGCAAGPTPTPTPSGELAEGVVLVSSTSAGVAGGVAFADEDILAYDIEAGNWSLAFDGSDAGLAAADVDGFELAADGSLYLSFDSPIAALPGLAGPVDDSDIVVFNGTLGPQTNGSFSWYFDGSDVGLATDGEDVDAIGFAADGSLLLSTIGKAVTGTAVAQDEDLLAFRPSQTGATTSGSWSVYFDGSDVGLAAASEDLSGAWLDRANNALYLTTAGAFSVPGVSGDDDDVFRCALTATGATTACVYGPGAAWNGTLHGFGREKIDGVGLLLP